MFNKIKLLHNWLETNSFSDEAQFLTQFAENPLELFKTAGVFEAPPEMLEEILDKGQKIWSEFLLSWVKLRKRILHKYVKDIKDNIIEHNERVFNKESIMFKIRRRWTRPRAATASSDVFFNENPEYIWERFAYYGYHHIYNEEDDTYTSINEKLPEITLRDPHWPSEHFKKSSILFRTLTKKEREYWSYGEEGEEDLFWLIVDATGDKYITWARGGTAPPEEGRETDSSRPRNASGPYNKEDLLNYIQETKEEYADTLKDGILNDLNLEKKLLNEVEELAKENAAPQGGGEAAEVNWFDENQYMILNIPINFSGWKYVENLKEKDEEGNYKPVDPYQRFHKGRSYVINSSRWMDEDASSKTGIKLGIYKRKTDVECDGSSLGCWRPTDWAMHVWTGKFNNNAREMKEMLDGFKKTLRHEAQHFAQDALRVIKFPTTRHQHNPIGIPAEAVRHRAMVSPNGVLINPIADRKKVAPFPMESDDPHSRIRHELRDVEFMPRVLDEVYYFLDLLDLDGGSPGPGLGRWPGKIPAEFWRLAIKYFTLMVPDVVDVVGEMRKIRENNNYFSNQDKSTGSSSSGDPAGIAADAPGMAQGDEYHNWARNFSQSHWFKYLHHYDRPRWKEAVLKFVGELDRLGILSMIPRTQRWNPVAPSQREEWGKSFITSIRPKRTTSYQDGKEKIEEEWVEMLPQWIREYDEFVASLSDIQLRRHKLLVNDSQDQEYWVTPRWREWDGRGEIEHHGGNVPEHPRLR